LPRNGNFNSLNENEQSSKATSSATSLNMINKPAIMHTSSVGGVAQVNNNNNVNNGTNTVNSISPKPYKWSKETNNISSVI
jgi:hypothetical protein